MTDASRGLVGEGGILASRGAWGAGAARAGAASGFSTLDWLTAAVLAALCMGASAIEAVSVSFSADEGVVGLMGLDILSGKLPTCYWYGQQYMGTLENILAAPFIRFLGPTMLAARMPSVIAQGLAVALAYLYLRRYAGRAAGISAALLVTISPVFIHDIDMRARGGYAITLLLSAVMLWVVSPRRRPTALRGVAAGLVAGLSFWTNPQTLQFSLPLAAYYVALAGIGSDAGGGEATRMKGTLVTGGRQAAIRAATMAGGFLVGILPIIIHYLLTGVFMRPPGAADGAISVLVMLPRRSLAAFGAASPAPPLLKAVTGALMWLFLMIGVARYAVLRVREGALRAPRPLDALVFAPLPGVVLLVANGMAYVPERYYYLIYFSLAIVASAGWWARETAAAAGGRLAWRRVAVAALSATLAANAVGLTVRYFEDPFREEYLSHDEIAQVEKVLSQENIRAVVTDYGLDYTLMYLTGLQVKALPVPLGDAWSTRYQDAISAVQASGRFAVVLCDQAAHEKLKDHMKPSRFEEFLAETGRHAAGHRLGRVTVYTRIERMNAAGDMVEYGQWALRRFPQLKTLVPAVNSYSATQGRAG